MSRSVQVTAPEKKIEHTARFRWRDAAHEQSRPWPRESRGTSSLWLDATSQATARNVDAALAREDVITFSAICAHSEAPLNKNYVKEQTWAWLRLT
jgi:hypothetical protein